MCVLCCARASRRKPSHSPLPKPSHPPNTALTPPRLACRAPRRRWPTRSSACCSRRRRSSRPQKGGDADRRLRRDRCVGDVCAVLCVPCCAVCVCAVFVQQQRRPSTHNHPLTPKRPTHTRTQNTTNKKHQKARPSRSPLAGYRTSLVRARAVAGRQHGVFVSARRDGGPRRRRQTAAAPSRTPKKNVFFCSAASV